jgi:hypothetical protein
LLWEREKERFFLFQSAKTISRFLLEGLFVELQEFYLDDCVQLGERKELTVP